MPSSRAKAAPCAFGVEGGEEVVGKRRGSRPLFVQGNQARSEPARQKRKEREAGVAKMVGQPVGLMLEILEDQIADPALFQTFAPALQDLQFRAFDVDLNDARRRPIEQVIVQPFHLHSVSAG